MYSDNVGAGDQSAVVEWLSDPRTHGGEPVERIDTHSAHVFLAGDAVYKLKRAVRYDFLDFSTRELRQASCEAEVRLNRRTAPDIYLRTATVTRQPGGFAFDGDGAPIDHVVVMRRFDQDGLFDRLATRGGLTRDRIRKLADEVADLHRQAEVRSDHGGADGIRWVVDRNGLVFKDYPDVLAPDEALAVTRDSSAALDRHTELLEHRRRAGHVRQCHGDLHLRNIVLIDERPVLFDAIEFNDRISCIDVLYDLAFLVMDLIRAGHAEHASTALNRYLEQQDELDGLAAMPLFLSARAGVRAKVHAIEARLADADHAPEDRRLAVEYLHEAHQFLETKAARLVAIGGFSGTGKSSMAAGLAPGLGLAPGAVVLRSDVIRKRLQGVAPETRLGAEAYTPEQNRAVYAALVAAARTVLRAGYSVIADAVFANEIDRAAIETLAREAGVRFTGLWLEAPVDVLKTRVGARARDASDAGAGVIDRQLAGSTGAVNWTRVDARASETAVLERVRSLI